MPDILVTGATGQLGRLVVGGLLREVAPARIAVLARDPSKASDLAAQGVEVRVGDYTDVPSLDRALRGIERALLISSSDLAPGARAAQHGAFIEAARRAPLPFLAYTSLVNADTSPIALAADHRDTEASLRASGVPHLTLRNGWYTENNMAALKGAVASGVLHGAAGGGRIAGATRADYAEAAVRALLDGRAGDVVELAGDEPYTLADLAAEAARASGRPVLYQDHEPAAFREALLAQGLPPPVADLLTDFDAGARAGALDDAGRALSRLIGRPTTPLRDVVAAALAA